MSLVIAAPILLTSDPAAPTPPEKHLLEFGWNTPLLQDMPAYLDAAQRLPCDGLVFNVASPQHEAGLAWMLFGAERVDRALLESLATEMADIEWGRLTHNFLRVNVSPGNIDWFDDFEPILYNMEAVARFAREMGFAGIMLDTEQYPSGFPIFDYSQQIYRDRYAYDQYEEQVYQRGQEVMAALNRGYPGVTVIYTYGLSLAAQTLTRDMLPIFHYGLLAPFVEGMIADANRDTLLVDGFEQSYGYSQRDQFQQAFDLITNRAAAFARDPERYRAVVRARFGLWPDHDCGEGLVAGGCPNGITPEAFRQALDWALQYSDGYVWVYSQRIPWYTGESIPPDWQEVLFSSDFG